MGLASSQTWTTYLDLAETREWLQFTGIDPITTDEMMQRVIDMACEWVQAYINRPVAPTTYTERHDGWSGEYIMLKHSPFLELVSCREWQSSGGWVTLPESTPENPIEGVQVDYATSRIMRTFAGYSWPRTFFPGSRNIEVTYTSGYNPIPPSIWTATVEMVAYWWRNTQQASRQAVRPMEYDEAPPMVGLWPGVPDRIADLLEPYRQIALA